MARRRRESLSVDPEQPHWSSAVLGDPLYTWTIPGIDVDTPVVRQFKADRHNTFGESLMHAWLAVAAHRLERINGPAAWQLWQDYSTFRILYADIMATNPSKVAASSQTSVLRGSDLGLYDVDGQILPIAGREAGGAIPDGFGAGARLHRPYTVPDVPTLRQCLQNPTVR